MPKILLVSRCAWTLYNFRSGQIRALRQTGAEVIGAGAGGDGYESRVEALGVPFVPLPVNKKGLNPRADLKLMVEMYRLYRQHRPDIVHHFTIKPVIYGSMAAYLARVPRIINTVTGLGYVFTENKASWLRQLVEFQYRLALGCAHHTFFQNRDDLEIFLSRRLVRASRSGLIPGSGVDTDYFSPPSPAGVQPSRDRPTFLMAARLLRDKGVYEFVEAARLVREHHPEARFQLLGKRDERNPTVIPSAELDEWQRQGVVEWLGHRDDVREPIAGADVVVLPSYREGLPRSLLEAASMGKPLITTEVAGCKDVVEHGVNGYLVPPRDSRALADSMRRLIEDPDERRRMGEAGRKKVIEQFDESLVIQAILGAYCFEKARDRAAS